MKHKLLVIALCCLSLSSMAQSGIYISPLVDETGLDSKSVSYLESKLQSVISANGYSDFDGITRFVLAAKVIETHKDITPTTPSRISVELEVYLKTGDIVDNKVYGRLFTQSRNSKSSRKNGFLRSKWVFFCLRCRLAILYATAALSFGLTTAGSAPIRSPQQMT